MLIKHKFILFVSLFFCAALHSQDVLYLNNGSKFEATVKEITPSEVKYKNFNNPEGPTYVITKGDVLLIEYSNGIIEILNKNPHSVSPVKLETEEQKKPEHKQNPMDMYYANKNSLMINGIALANSDITLLYDREFAQGKFSVTVLGGYNFNEKVTLLNSNIRTLSTAKKNFDIGLGINYYTSIKRKTQYFCGILVKYMNFSYQKTIHDSSFVAIPAPGFYFQTTTFKPAQDYQLATMIVNGIQVRLTPTVNYKLFVGLGGWTPHADLKEAMKTGGSGNNTAPTSYYEPPFRIKIYLGMCFGYRF